MKQGEREKTKIDCSITFNSHSEGLRRTVAAARRCEVRGSGNEKTLAQVHV